MTRPPFGLGCRIRGNDFQNVSKMSVSTVNYSGSSFQQLGLVLIVEQNTTSGLRAGKRRNISPSRRSDPLEGTSRMEWRPCCTECISFSNCIFCAPNRQELLGILATQKPLSFKKNSAVYCEGFPAEGVFILCRGSVKLISTTSVGVQRIAGLVKAGELFGLDALLPPHVRLFTAVARGSCVGFFIERKRFCHIVRSKADLLWRFAMALNRALHDSERIKLAISGDRVRKRLYNALLFLSESQVSLTRNKDPRSVAMRQTELSELLGIPAETVNRELRNMSDKGVVTNKLGNIVIAPRLLKRSA